MKSMIFSVLLTLFSSMAFAEQLELPLQPRQCIQLPQAQQVLTSYLSSLMGQVPSEDFPWLDCDAPVVTYKDVKKAAASLRWNAKTFKFESTTIAEGYCAPAASCWGWYTVDCQGKIQAEENGED